MTGKREEKLRRLVPKKRDEDLTADHSIIIYEKECGAFL